MATANCCGTGVFADENEFQRLHDFYSLRLAAHQDPQFEERQIFSWKDVVGHTIRLTCASSACKFFIDSIQMLHRCSGKDVSDGKHKGSKSELLFLFALGCVMMASLATSR